MQLIQSYKDKEKEIEIKSQEYEVSRLEFQAKLIEYQKYKRNLRDQVYQAAKNIEQT